MLYKLLPAGSICFYVHFRKIGCFTGSTRKSIPVRIVHSIVSKVAVRGHFIVFIILDLFASDLNW